MSRLSRYTQLIFGSTAGSSQIAEFGSLAASAPVTYSGSTVTPALIQALSNYLTGWFGAVEGENSPAIEDMNALGYLFAYQLAYIMQAGVAEYDAATTYYSGNMVNSGGVLYVSNANSNVGNALTNSTYWSPLFNRSQTFTTNSVWVCPAGVSRATLVADPNVQALPMMGMMGWPIDVLGNMWAWGNNSGGALGTGDATTTTRSIPTLVAGSINWGRCAIIPLGTANSFMGAIDDYGNMYTWGFNTQGMLGTGSATPAAVSSPVLVVGGNKYQKATALNGNWLALDYAGNIWFWGSNLLGIGGDGTILSRSSPVKVVGGLNFSDIGGCVGGVTQAALTTSGAIYCWGFNANGACGNGVAPNSVSSYSSPVLVTGGITFSKIGVTTQGNDGFNTANTMAAIDTAGNIWTWGSNNYGQLGIGVPGTSLAAVSSPVMVIAAAKFVDVVEISVGLVGGYSYGTFYALDTNGNIWSWGCNYAGLLGTGVAGTAGGFTTTSSPVMISAGGTRFVELSKNYYNSIDFGGGGVLAMYALDQAGNIWAWGANSAGCLGTGSNNTSLAVSSPTLVVGGHVFVAMSSLAGQGIVNASGFGGMAAMDVNGQVWTWGPNGPTANAYLGIGVPGSTTLSVSSPTLISNSTSSFKAVVPEAIRSVPVVPGVSYAVTVQSVNCAFGGTVLGRGVNKLTIVY